MSTNLPDEHPETRSYGGSTLDARDVSAPRAPLPAQAGAWLLVFEGDSSTLVPLPSTGEFILGRGEGCQIVLDEAGVSRQHARIWLGRGQARIADLGSQNGTLVNGVRIGGGAAPLHSGDEIDISGITVVFHASAISGRQNAFVDSSGFRVRLEAELERARKYVRPVTVAVVNLGGRADRQRLPIALQDVIHRIEVMAVDGDDTLLWLLPELGADQAEERAMDLLGELGKTDDAVRMGLATSPDDGIDPDALIAAAREAAKDAAVGQLRRASRTFKELTLGDQRAWIADAVMIRLYALLERLAKSDLPVLVMGETGTGKEIAAKALHHFSPRAQKRMVVINCGALPENLVESELFGHERGSFTGAVANRIGAFEAADGGTVFLDELGELSLTTQAKLLRAIETKRISRVGDTRERAVDFRVVAATNRNLETEVKAGRFREDLFFRLSGAAVWIPPLRDRKRELLILARAFLEMACERAGRPQLELSPAAIQVLAEHAWPGNVRELRNVMEYAAATVTDPQIDPWHLSERLAGTEAREAETEESPEPPESISPPSRFRPLLEEVRELERRRMLQALKIHQWKQNKAAQALGMPLRTFVTKMGLYELRAERER